MPNSRHRTPAFDDQSEKRARSKTTNYRTSPRFIYDVMHAYITVIHLSTIQHIPDSCYYTNRPHATLSFTHNIINNPRTVRNCI